ncbi:phosphonate ABC transporter substrate-binding protein [Candidatus Woesearchaeota archaeon]|nr:phosphonate ABC transporter substrate-binding protein [archaeon]MBL7055176.1 phosphonate ABC transporter substrate-binding protein [Candidatus Woesearchaeota archaeon]
MKNSWIVVLLVLMLVITGCQSGENNTGEEQQLQVLRMGLIPADDAEEIIRAYEPVKEYLSEALGIPVEIQVTSDYTAAIEAMRGEHIDMAWFGPFSYIIASNVAGAEAIVNGVKESTGSATYKSIIVAGVSTGIETVEDLRGKSFAFVDPASTSGNLIPRKMLIENGIDPDNDFSTSYYAGTHNAVLYAIANGKVDAGATGDNVYQRMVDAGEIDPEANVIIYESEPIPGSPIAVRGNLPEELKKAIQDALLNMDQQTIHQVDGWGGISSYQAVSDSDYDVIRETAEILGMDVSNPDAANN